MCNFFGNGNNCCSWIILLIVILACCGGNESSNGWLLKIKYKNNPLNCEGVKFCLSIKL